MIGERQSGTMLMDLATPNLPSRDFAVTAGFYGALGFEERWRDAGWMILVRGSMTLEFFLYPEFDPYSSSFGSCLRFDEVAPFVEVVIAAGVPEQETGQPRVQRPKREAWGGLVGALIDPDGSLLRLIEAPAEERG